VGMVIFYLVGILVRSTVKDTIDKVKAVMRKKEEEKKLAEELERMKEQIKKEDSPGSRIDLAIGDDSILEDDDFEALPIAEFIKRELQ